MQPDESNSAPTAQNGQSQEGNTELLAWLQLAQSAYRGSTDYVNSSYRKQWEDSLRAFNNMHSSDSKYNQPAYEKRSRTYRPRTRAVIRKNEAAAAAAFFSNMDVVSVGPQDPSSKAECASADVMKEILQYRLTKSIPWYQIVLGGLQDAQTVSVACAHIYWDYEAEPVVEDAVAEVKPIALSSEEYPDQKDGELPRGAAIATQEGGLQNEQVPEAEPEAVQVDITAEVEPKAKVDKPCVELIPVENLRFDPAASWVDPVNSSPYFIHLMPMYVLDIKEKMEGGDWKKYSDETIAKACDGEIDTTRIARNKGSEDPYKAGTTTIDDYDIAWVQRHIHRKGGQDWEFYMLSDLVMLTTPQLLKERVFHGKRPYVIGSCMLETHKVMPASVAQLGKGLQEEINEIANQRIDNVKFVLNKKWFVKRGKEADVMGLVRNVPGGVVMLDDPVNDVREITWPDVTGSSFQEHQNLNMELDELLGNFNPAAIMAAGSSNSPAKNMAMLSNSQGTLVEYLLRTFVETFVQPCLRQVVLLEQEYETDQVVMKIAGKRAKIFQKYGIDEVTDELLTNELTLTVNVGMGATDPMQKLQKFLAGLGSYTTMLQHPTPGINMEEVGKEIFGHLGYADGSRFFTNDNPQIIALQGQLQQASQALQQLQQKLNDRQVTQKVKLQVADMNNKTSIVKTQISEKAANQRALATHFRALVEAEHNSNQKKIVNG